MKSFVDELKDWTDMDGAMHVLAVHLGMFKGDSSWGLHKGIYWTNNLYCNSLHDMIMKMVEMGLLEYDEDGSRVRANLNFEIKL